MREELRRSNSIGTENGIDLFLDLVFVQGTQSVDALHHAFRFHSPAQFNCHLALLFFEELNLIKVSSKKVEVTKEGTALSVLAFDSQKAKLSELIFDRLLQENLINYERISFEPSNGELKIPSNAFSLTAAVYRNFLYEIGCFSKNGIYFSIANKMLRNRLETEIANKKRKTSQAELLLQLQKQQEDGDIGELFVVEYEKRRIAHHLRPPKRISLIDVGAGYDILSCNALASPNYDRYIEVKSFRGQPDFYWSSNEKHVAEALGKNYFLYLVDLSAVEQNKENYAPQIIANPAVTLCSDDWLIEPDSYRVISLK